MKKIVIKALAMAAVLAAAPFAAQAGAYPDKPVKMIVGFSPGGFTDVVARLVANELGKRLNQTVIVENKPGAAGTIAADMVSRAAPDGYTLLMGHSNSNAAAPALYKNLSYDVVKDFTPIALVTSTPLILTTTAKLNIHNMKDFMAVAKKGELRFASSGVGSSQHLAAAQFMQHANIKMLHVPYKGSSQALIDLLSGEVDLNVDSPPLMVPNIKSGKLNGIAITSAKRSPLIPDVPTMAEAGFPGVNMSQWFGLVGPAHLPKDITDMLNKEVNAILQSPDVLKKLADNGAEPGGGTPADFAALIKTDTAKIQKVVTDAGIKIE